MANNQYVNKVVYGGHTLIDITDSTVESSTLPLGTVAYDASGARITGEAIIYNIQKDTTANWNAKTTYVPQPNDIIVYIDKDTIEEAGVTKYVPGIKLGDGNAYVVDLPFVTDAIAEMISDHVGDTTAHVTSTERAFWNNKLNLTISGEELQFNRL